MFDGRDNGAVSLYHNGSEKLATTSTGISVTGNATFADNGKAIFGAGSDLQIYHDGSNSYIDEQGTGNLNVRGTNLVLGNASGSNSYLAANDGGGVYLYHAGQNKIETTSTGVDITGTLTSDGLTVNSGTNNTVAKFESSDAGAFIILEDSGSTNDGNRIAVEGDVMSFATGDSERMRLDASGNVGIGTSSNLLSGSNRTTVSINNTSSAAIAFGVNGTREGHIYSDTSALEISSASNPMRFTAGDSERMRLDASGNLGIGTSSPSDSNSFGKALDVSGTTGAALYLRDGTDGDVGIFGQFNNATSINSKQADGIIVLYTGASNNERMRIDSSGNLLVGKTSSSFSTEGSQLNSNGSVDITKSGGAALFVNRLSSDGDIIKFYKDGTTVGSIGTLSSRLHLVNGDTGLRFAGDLDAIWPCNGSGGDRDNAIDLGSTGIRFDDIYATNGTIQTSDRNEKQDIAELTDAEQRVAVAAKGLLRKFRWKDAVAEKGDEARTHFGIIAQDLQAAFAAEGLDAGDYAMFISSTWTDEETGEERTRMGVRYSELLAFIIGAL